MDINKDSLEAVSIAGGLIASAIGFYFWVRYKIKKHDDKLMDHEERIHQIECDTEKTDRKLGIIHANLVKTMEHMKIDPVPDLFENER